MLAVSKKKTSISPGAGRSVDARFLPIRSEHYAAWTRGYVRYRTDELTSREYHLLLRNNNVKCQSLASPERLIDD